MPCDAGTASMIPERAASLTWEGACGGGVDFKEGLAGSSVLPHPVCPSRTDTVPDTSENTWLSPVITALITGQCQFSQLFSFTFILVGLGCIFLKKQT